MGGAKRKEPEPGAGGAEVTLVKQTKKQKTAAGAAGPAAAAEVGGDASKAAKPSRKPRAAKPKAQPEASPGPGAGPEGLDEPEPVEDTTTHEKMRELLRKKKLEDAERMKCAQRARCLSSDAAPSKGASGSYF